MRHRRFDASDANPRPAAARPMQAGPAHACLWLYASAGAFLAMAGMAHAQDTKPVGQPASNDRAIEVPSISQFTGVLTPKGTLILEPQFEYSTWSLNRVILEGYTVIPAITVGSIDIRQVDRNMATAALTARYGLTDRLEVDVRVPYVYRYDSLTARPAGTGADQDAYTDVEGAGLGDVEFGLHYQINAPQGGGAFYVANLRGRAPTGEDPFEVPLDADGLETELPTGTGFWAVEPSLTVLFPSDPAVFFANFGYLWNIERDVGTVNGTPFGKIDPGDAARVSFGMGYGINERASFSIGYEHNYVFKSKQDGVDIDGTDLQVGSLLFGVSYRVSERVSYNLNVSLGATDEAPDARVLLRIPIRFNLF